MLGGITGAFLALTVFVLGVQIHRVRTGQAADPGARVAAAPGPAPLDPAWVAVLTEDPPLACEAGPAGEASETEILREALAARTAELEHALTTLERKHAQLRQQTSLAGALRADLERGRHRQVRPGL